MKTAMQELIDMAGILPLKTFHVWLGENYERLLEKEKRQLYHSFNCGADRVCEKEFNIWFNQTYNQNK